MEMCSGQGLRDLGLGDAGIHSLLRHTLRSVNTLPRLWLIMQEFGSRSRSLDPRAGFWILEQDLAESWVYSGWKKEPAPPGVQRDLTLCVPWLCPSRVPAPPSR